MIFSGCVHLLENRELGNDNLLAAFAAPEIGAAARPAQFVMLRMQEGTDPLLGRPFSIARIGKGETGSTVELLYKVTGRGTDILGRLRPGATVHMVGPLGNPFPEPVDAGGPVFFVAGGIGIAPFPILGEHLQQQGISARLLYGARTAADLIARDLVQACGVSCSVATDDGSEGHHGFVTGTLEQALQELTKAERGRATAYVCGPTPMMQAADAVLGRFGVAGHFSVEAFMGCGFGVCLSCVIPVFGAGGEEKGYRRICVDGPTFPVGRIDWSRAAAP